MTSLLHQLLLELTPGGAKKDLSAAQAKAMLATVRPRDAAGKTRRRVAAELIGDLERIYSRKKAADKELRELVAATGSSLMDLHGIGPSGAARLLVEVGDITRFPNRNHFASWTGTAPIDASSGDQVRHRLSRAGNRQINRVLHTMAVVQLRPAAKHCTAGPYVTPPAQRHADACALASCQALWLGRSWGASAVPNRSEPFDMRAFQVRRAIALISVVVALPVSAQQASADHGDQRGTAGSDRLEGTEHRDILFGLRGADIIKARSNKDRLFGGRGDDVLHAGGGDDTAMGGGGDDRVLGNEGDDYIKGQNGRDRLWGAGGIDLLRGGTDDDRLGGSAESDRLYGGLGADIVGGGGGGDYARGGFGWDQLFGGKNADVLDGGPGRDRLFGEDGDDRLRGGEGPDRLRANDGSDRVSPGGGSDVARLGSGNDVAVLAFDGEPDVVWCGPGSDTVVIIERADPEDTFWDCEVMIDP